jgi:hypothetical protein
MELGDGASMTKKQRVQEKLKKMEQRLCNAQEYVARNVNVESHSFLHFKDWQGKSGHPLWIKNHMIPATKQARARQEKALERLMAKAKEKKSRVRRSTPQK